MTDLIRYRTLPILMVLLLAWVAGEASARSEKAPTLLVFGDSLSAAYGMPAERGWVALLGPRMAERGWNLVNASMSGETTAGGRARLDAALDQHAPALVLIELGANDALRGLPIALMQANLDHMVAASKQANAEVLLVGMRIPPNYGPDYAAAFEQAFRQVSQKHGVPLLPFLLEPIALDREAFQDDQLHPTTAAQPILAEYVWKQIEPLIERAPAHRGQP